MSNILSKIVTIGDTFGAFLITYVVLSGYLHIESMIISIVVGLVVAFLFRQFYMLTYSLNFAALSCVVIGFSFSDHGRYDITQLIIFLAVLKISMVTCRCVSKRWYMVDQHEKKLGVDPSSFMIGQILVAGFLYVLSAALLYEYISIPFTFISEAFVEYAFYVILCLINLGIDYFILRPIDIRFDEKYGYYLG